MTRLKSYSKSKLILLVAITLITLLGITVTVSGVTSEFMGQLVESFSKQGLAKEKDLPGGVAGTFYLTENLQTSASNNGSVPNSVVPQTSSKSSQSSSSLSQDHGSYSCTKTNILPYTTTHVNAHYLATGQTEASGGTDGYTYVCPSGNGKTTSTVFETINKTIYVGTGPTQTEIQASNDAAIQSRQEQAALVATNARNTRISNCISNMRSLMPGGGSSLDDAISQCYSTP